MNLNTLLPKTQKHLHLIGNMAFKYTNKFVLKTSVEGGQKKKGGYMVHIYGSHLEKLNRRKVVEHANQIHAYIYI